MLARDCRCPAKMMGYIRISRIGRFNDPKARVRFSRSGEAGIRRAKMSNQLRMGSLRAFETKDGCIEDLRWRLAHVMRRTY